MSLALYTHTPSPTPTTTYLDFFPTDKDIIMSCIERHSRTFVQRPCPTQSCDRHQDVHGTCSMAPESVIKPPMTVALVDCTESVFEGHACTPCDSNYCTRDLLPSESTVGACPLGLVTAVGVRRCNEPRCAWSAPLPQCPTTTPVVDWSPDIYTNWGSCSVSVGTGMVCSGCDHYCTMDGNVPADPMTGSCSGELTTKTMARACPTTVCGIPNQPRWCGEEETSETRETPWTDTVGCEVYVQTGGAEECAKCVEPACISGTELPPEATMTE